MTHGQVIHLEAAGGLVLDLVEVIHQNRQRLSAIDGAIGDGDHGVNMDKGFSQCGAKLAALPALPGLPQAFEMLALTLMDDIGGSMGPLYGSFFLGLVFAIIPLPEPVGAARPYLLAMLLAYWAMEIPLKVLSVLVIKISDGFSTWRKPWLFIS